MYVTLHNILSDKTGGDIFVCFGAWHFFYIFLAIAAITLSLYFTRNKCQKDKNRLLNILISIAFGLYMLDFFLMPFAYGEIDIEKLPFHSCTSMCIMCFVSRVCGALKKYRQNFALLALISNLVYLLYPAGVMWYQIHPLSYRVIRTLLFHAIMVVYCLLSLLLDSDGLKIKEWYSNLVILCSLTIWAIIGNALYSGTLDELDYNKSFNWFFVKNDPFYAIPSDISPYVMPFINITAFLAVEIMFCLIITEIRKLKFFKKRF